MKKQFAWYLLLIAYYYFIIEQVNKFDKKITYVKIGRKVKKENYLFEKRDDFSSWLWK